MYTNKKSVKNKKPLPLPDGYYNDQIDEVSSARTSVIEHESDLNIQIKDPLTVRNQRQSQQMSSNEGKALGYQKLKLAKLPQTFTKKTSSSRSNLSQKSKSSKSKDKKTKIKDVF